jgi:hypothetical protein
MCSELAKEVLHTSKNIKIKIQIILKMMVVSLETGQIYLCSSHYNSYNYKQRKQCMSTLSTLE